MEPVDLLFVVLGGIAALVSAYLVLLSIAALFYRPGRGARTGSRLAVVIPAHDEGSVVGRCIASLRQQTYDRDRYEIVVVADNCTDDTAAVAAAAGATVLVRNDPDARGKGHALRFAFDHLLQSPTPPDALAVVDADSSADPRFLEMLAGVLERGAEAAQGESLLSNEGPPAAALRAAAFLLVNRTRPSGRAVLGLPAALAGNGMLFTSELLRRQPWTAFSSTEDVEYGVRLRLAGVDPVFAGGAILWSLPPPNPVAAAQQQLRWEGGKFHVARTLIPSLLTDTIRRRRPLLLDAAWELAVPPLGYLAAFGVATAGAGGVLLGFGELDAWALIPALAAVAGIPVHVLVGLRAAHAPAWAYRALGRSPLFLLRKLTRMHMLLGFRADSWVRTERPGE